MPEIQNSFALIGWHQHAANLPFADVWRMTPIAAFSPFASPSGTASSGRKYALPAQQKTRAQGSTHDKFRVSAIRENKCIRRGCETRKYQSENQGKIFTHDTVCNWGIRWPPLGDAIFPCKELKTLKIKKSDLTRKNAKPVTCGFNKQKNRGSRTPPDATLFHDFRYSRRDTFAYRDGCAADGSVVAGVFCKIARLRMCIDRSEGPTPAELPFCVDRPSGTPKTFVTALWPPDDRAAGCVNAIVFL